jgi:hypothetical protein
VLVGDAFLKWPVPSPALPDVVEFLKGFSRLPLTMQSGEMKESLKIETVMTLQHFNEEDFSRLDDRRPRKQAGKSCIREKANEFPQFQGELNG